MSTKVKNLPREKWSKIKFDRLKIAKTYYVSQFGRLKSVDNATKKEVIIKGTKESRGYLKINARRKGIIEQRLIHKEVAKNYVKKGGKRNLVYVVHKDYNKENNDYRNLKWVSKKGLAAYQKEKEAALGIVRKKARNVKLTASKVAMLKKELNRGKKTKQALAEKYKVTTTQIKRIERGENWGHVAAKK